MVLYIAAINLNAYQISDDHKENYMLVSGYWYMLVLCTSWEFWVQRKAAPVIYCFYRLHYLPSQPKKKKIT
jgi:hypothetical protein